MRMMFKLLYLVIVLSSSSVVATTIDVKLAPYYATGDGVT